MSKIPEFKSFQEAMQWMIETVDDPCIDNIRSTFIDSEKGLTTYEKRKSEGCCGFFDTTIIINRKLAKIGCNFGH